MKKKIKATSKVTATPDTSTLVSSGNLSSTLDVKVCKKVEKLELDLGRGDLNILRDKINEVIDKQNGC